MNLPVYPLQNDVVQHVLMGFEVIPDEATSTAIRVEFSSIQYSQTALDVIYVATWGGAILHTHTHRL